MLEAYIREQRRHKKILLMTHIVIGYPSLEESLAVVQSMVAAGVDLIELQIPFSEPIADGPVILRANQDALACGITVEQCLSFAEEVARSFDIPFLFMTYYNILFRYGVENFIREMAARGVRGAIVPDLPFEEADDYLRAMRERGLDPIFIYAPTTGVARMTEIAKHARGFIYCVARKGVTGQHTRFGKDLEGYLERCRAAVTLPLALGFGVKEKSDIDFLTGKVDVAVIGSETIRVLDGQGAEAVGGFIRGLR